MLAYQNVVTKIPLCTTCDKLILLFFSILCLPYKSSKKTQKKKKWNNVITVPVVSCYHTSFFFAFHPATHYLFISCLTEISITAPSQKTFMLNWTKKKCVGYKMITSNLELSLMANAMRVIKCNWIDFGLWWRSFATKFL